MNKKLFARISIFAGITAISTTLAWQSTLADNGFDAWEPRTLRVDCAHRTIGSVLKSRRSQDLVIVVQGNCREDVVIERDRVTLVAATPGVDGIVSTAPDGVAVTVSGARGIIIDGLRLQSSGGGSPTGVFVTRNGDATIQNALIDGNAYGVWANHGGFFLVRDSDVVDNVNYGVFLTDGGNARVQDSTVEINNPDRINSAAVGAFRGVNLRFRGDNEIRNMASDGLALDLVHSIDFRQDGGHTRFVGSLEFANLVNASLRDPEIEGGIDVVGGSRVDIRNSSTDADEVTGEGGITVAGNSRLAFSRANITAQVGSIHVDEYSSLYLGDDVSVTVADSMTVNGSRFAMGPRSSIAVNDAGGLFLADFSTMFAGDNVTIAANMDFGGSINKVNLFGFNVNYSGDLFFSSRSTLDFGQNAMINGNIDCGGGDVHFEGAFTISNGGLANCLSFP